MRDSRLLTPSLDSQAKLPGVEGGEGPDPPAIPTPTQTPRPGPDLRPPTSDPAQAPLPFFHFADVEKARKALQAAGFAADSVRTEIVSSAASLKAHIYVYIDTPSNAYIYRSKDR